MFELDTGHWAVECYVRSRVRILSRNANLGERKIWAIALVLPLVIRGDSSLRGPQRLKPRFFYRLSGTTGSRALPGYVQSFSDL